MIPANLGAGDVILKSAGAENWKVFRPLFYSFDKIKRKVSTCAFLAACSATSSAPAAWLAGLGKKKKKKERVAG